MIKQSIFVFCGLCLALLNSTLVFSEEIPNIFIGNWNIKVVPQSGYPWWRDIKHPVKLSISRHGILLTDQNDYKCDVSKFAYDPEISKLIFSHCGIGNKSENSFEIIQVVGVDESGKMLGEVKNYKTLFHWRGTRQETDKQ